MAYKAISLLFLQAVAAAPALQARDGITCPTANSTVVAVGGKNWSIECGLDTYFGDMPAPNGQTFPTFDQCIQSCVDRSGCQAVAYMGKACYLKGSIPRRVTKDSVWGAVITTTAPSAAASAAGDCYAAPSAASVAPSRKAASAIVPKSSSKAAIVFGQAKSSAAAAAPAAASAAAPVFGGVKQAVPQSYAAAAPTPSAAASSGSTGSDGSCARPAAKSLSSKRGVAYNDVGMVAPFAGKASWAYNWGSTSSGTMPSGISYVPMLWSPSNGGASWSNVANAAIANGADVLLGFNEPDHTDQAHLSVADAVTGWKTYMEPLKCKARLASPAVTNGAVNKDGSPMGLTYLKNFMAACTGCTIDIAVVHWYDSASNVAYFKNFIQDAYAAGGNRPLWITEFGASGSDADQASFFKQVLPWLDSLSYVERYSYFMASAGKLVTASKQLSTIGQAYVDA